jgi:hypothetical protein
VVALDAVPFASIRQEPPRVTDPSRSKLCAQQTETVLLQHLGVCTYLILEAYFMLFCRPFAPRSVL